MAYLSLYRRQRPLAFSGMTGQDHVTRTLSHAISRGQLAHAYLFSGPRGTGKTTAAKIMARAVNCRNYPAPEPCGECVSCGNILKGVSLDVVEMDAASNRGIEEIRDLRERTRYVSGESRFKVYIIDEAHMLTNEACNAFLKTLEEPPSGVIFILATTDPFRLPSTIVSRCQRFDFHLLSLSQIMQRLKQILKEEGWQADEDALRLISRLAEGSLRDALGLLEQCRAYGDEFINVDHVIAVTGATRSDMIGSLIGAVAEGKLDNALGVLQQITYSGRDLSLFLSDLLYVFSRLLLYGKINGRGMEDNCCGFEDIFHLFAGRFERKALLEIIELLYQVSGELRYAHNPQFALEIALIRIVRALDLVTEQCREEGQVDWLDSAPVSHERQAVAEAKLLSLAENKDEAAALCSGGVAEQGDLAHTVHAQEVATSGNVAKNVTKDSGDDLERFWPRILAEVKKSQLSTHDYLAMAQAKVLQGGRLVLTYRKGIFAAERIGEKGHRQLVERALNKILTRPVRLVVVVSECIEEIAPPGSERTAVDLSPREVVNRKKKQSVPEEGYDFEDALKLFGGTLTEQEKETKS